MPAAPVHPTLVGDRTGQRLVIETIDVLNFKSYGGEATLGPFHKVFPRNSAIQSVDHFVCRASIQSWARMEVANRMSSIQCCLCLAIEPRNFAQTESRPSFTTVIRCPTVIKQRLLSILPKLTTRYNICPRVFD